MISEVDIRDWDRVNIPQAKVALDNFDDYARMAGIEPIGPLFVLNQFIQYIEEIKKKQTRHIPVLEKKMSNQ